MKAALIFFCIIFTMHTAFSQPYSKGTFTMSAGAEAVFVEAKLGTTHRNGWGGTVKGEYVFDKHTTAILSGGYYHLQGKNTSQEDYASITAIPIKAGVRYYFGNFYGAAEGGAIFFTNYNSGSGFVYTLGLGDKLKIGGQVFDIGLRQEWWAWSGSSRGVFALRVAYEFAVT